MRTRQQKQIIAHQNKLNKILRSRDPPLIKICSIMDLLVQIRKDADSARLDSDISMAKIILTARAIKKIT